MSKKKLKKTSDRPWYHEGLQFECQACGRCCGGAPGYIWATREELERAAEAVGMHVLDFCQMYVAEYEEGFSLREMDNGDCCMLQNDKCRIYDVRPMQCRTWPFWPSNLSSPKAWQMAKQRCPGMDRGRLWSPAEIERLKNKVLV
ncbi:MAG: YkgJ family cysteine cluster protein [Planctomycetes bacterium]|nr:YkgJ family cysteine cluster protein [Planctomycetota bacterium]